MADNIEVNVDSIIERLLEGKKKNTRYSECARDV